MHPWWLLAAYRLRLHLSLVLHPPCVPALPNLPPSHSSRAHYSWLWILHYCQRSPEPSCLLLFTISWKHFPRLKVILQISTQCSLLQEVLLRSIVPYWKSPSMKGRKEGREKEREKQTLGIVLEHIPGSPDCIYTWTCLHLNSEHIYLLCKKV